MTDGDEVVLTLYGRAYCHLCNDMIAALQPLQSRFQFTLRIIDVDSDAQLEQRYGDKVPVLMMGDSELCHYFFNESAVTAALAKIR